MADYWWDIEGKKGLAEVVKVFELTGSLSIGFFKEEADATYAKDRVWKDAVVMTRYAVRFDDGMCILLRTAKTQEEFGKSGFLSFSARADADAEFKRRARLKLTDADAQALGVE